MRAALYLRVSTTDQTTENQERELRAAACAPCLVWRRLRPPSPLILRRRPSRQRTKCSSISATPAATLIPVCS